MRPDVPRGRTREGRLKTGSETVVTGLLAGFVAGAAVIALFFFFDLLRGEPLATPAFLSGVLFGEGASLTTSVRIGLLTVFHFGAFMVLGAIAAVVIEGAEVPPNYLVGAAYGLFACSLAFFLALVVANARILEAPGWPIVFAGNLIAGIVIVRYLNWAGRERGAPGTMEAGGTPQVIREGVAAGLIGAAVVALWFLVLDSVVGRPLYTPAALGSALLYGVSGADAVVVGPGTVRSPGRACDNAQSIHADRAWRRAGRMRRWFRRRGIALSTATGRRPIRNAGPSRRSCRAVGRRCS